MDSVGTESERHVEPASALDPISTQRIEELITELSSQVTIIIVTHEDEIAKRCHRVIKLKDGRIVSDTSRGAPPPAPDAPRRAAEAPPQAVEVPQPLPSDG